MPTTYFECAGTGQTAELLKLAQDAATSTFVMSVARGTPQVATFRATGINPGAGVSNTGTFTVAIQLTTASDVTGNCSLAVSLVRYNSAGTAQATVAVGASQTITSTGTKTFTGSNLALGTWTATDFLGMTATITNNNTTGSAKTFTVQIGGATNTVVVPWTQTVSTNLTVANAAQAQTAGNVALTQNSVLVVQNAAQAETAGAVTITTGPVQVNLTVQNASQAQTAGSANVSVPAVLLGEWGFLDNTNDTSGNGRTATLVGSPTYEAGPQTNTRALRIDSTSEGVNYGRTGLEPTQASGGIVTMAWVKVYSDMNAYEDIITKMRLFDSTRHTLSVESSNLFYMSRWRGRLQFASIVGAFSGANLGVWRHVCNIDADDRWAILIDGVQVAGSTDPQSASLPAWEDIPWLSGTDANNSLPSNNPNLSVTAVRIFSGTMTNSEVVTWMNTPIAGTGAISLTVQNASQAETAGTPTLVRNISLTVANAAQAETAGAPTLVRNISLTTQNASQAQTATTPTLALTTGLVVQGATQSETATSPTLTQIHVLSVQGASQADAASSPALTQVHILTVQNANQAQTVGSPALTLTYILALQSASQVQTAGSPVLTQVHNLAVQGTNQGQTAGSPAIARIHNLLPQSVTQAQTAGSPALTQLHVLTVQGSRQNQVVGNAVLVVGGITLTVANARNAQTAGAVVLTQVHILTTQNANQAQGSTSPSLTQVHVLAVQNAAQAQGAQSPALVQVQLLVVQNTIQTQSAGAVAMVQVHILTTQNANQSQSSGSPGLTQVHILAVQGTNQNQVVDTFAISQVQFLDVLDAIQAQAVGNVVLSDDVILLVSSTSQVMQTESVTITLRVRPTAKERRLKIQALLEELLGSGNVYYQPPPNTKMQYPCIVYGRSYEKSQFAANNPYIVTKRYTVTVIDRNPDSEIPDKIAALPMCRFQRFFTADNLNHDVFDLYFT